MVISKGVFTDDGAWCWFGDPRALYFEGKFRRTYSGWVDHKGNIWIGYYDHDLDTIVSEIIHPELLADDHNHPTLHILPDGHILVFYVRHMKNSPMYLMRCVEPENIRSWETREVLSLNDTLANLRPYNRYSYPCVVSLPADGGKLFLFFRGINSKQSISVSSDNGLNWTMGAPLFPLDEKKRPTRPYLKVSSNSKDRIHLAFTNDHPKDDPNNSIWYACYRAGRFYRADGSLILGLDELPMQITDADLVYDASQSGRRSWIWDVADDNNHPVVLYVRFEDERNHVYCYARWNGDRWINHSLVNAGGWFPQTPDGEEEKQMFYSGGLVFDHDNPSVIYLSRQIEGIFEIERWTTPDSGYTWTVAKITSGSAYDNVRPFAVRNALESNAIQVMWMSNRRYIGYRDYFTAIHYE